MTDEEQLEAIMKSDMTPQEQVAAMLRLAEAHWQALTALVEGVAGYAHTSLPATLRNQLGIKTTPEIEPPDGTTIHTMDRIGDLQAWTKDDGLKNETSSGWESSRVWLERRGADHASWDHLKGQLVTPTSREPRSTGQTVYIRQPGLGFTTWEHLPRHEGDPEPWAGRGLNNTIVRIDWPEVRSLISQPQLNPVSAKSFNKTTAKRS